MYYPCSESKGADQLRSYHETDLRLCFRICRLLVLPRSGSHVGYLFHLFQIRRELKTMMTEQQQAGTRALSDMDARMNGIKQRMTTLEDQLDARVASVSHIVGENYIVSCSFTFN